MNDKIREARLKKDNYECQLSKLFGIAEISGKLCSKDLEIHHKTYVRYGHEDIEDIITVCTRCHDVLTDAIRRERYATRLLKNSKMITGLCVESEPYNDILKVEVVKNVGKVKISDCGGSASANAQSAVGQRTRSYREGYQRDILKKEEG